MSIIRERIDHAGDTLCGQVLHQSDEDSLHCAFDLTNLGCGMSYEQGAARPYLRFTPAIQIPRKARSAVKQLLFTHPDDRFGDMALDETDGEVTMRRNVKRFEDAEVQVSDCLQFLDTVAYPAILACVAENLATGSESDDEDDEDGGMFKRFLARMGG